MKLMRWMASIVVLGLVAIGPPPADAQGRVNILCSPDPAWCEAVKQSFGKATGIQTEFVRLSSGAALARLRAEKDAPAFDVWFGGSGDSPVGGAGRGADGVLQAEGVGRAPAAADEGGGRALHPALHGTPRARRSTRSSSRRRTCRFRRRGRTSAIRSTRGSIAMPNPNTSGTGYLLMTTLVQTLRR